MTVEEMIVTLYVFVAVCAFGIILLVGIRLLTVRVKLDYCRNGPDDTLTVSVSLVRGWISYSKTTTFTPTDNLGPAVAPFSKENNRGRFKLTTFRTVWGKWQYVLSQIAYFSRRSVRCQQLKWQTVIGTGDAAETALLIGLLWGVKSSVSAVASRYFIMETVPQFRLHPDYAVSRLETRVTCILAFRLGEAILTTLRILLHIARGRHKKKWQTTLSKV